MKIDSYLLTAGCAMLLLTGCQKSLAKLEAGNAGGTMEGANTLLTAFPIRNTGKVDVQNVQVSSASLGNAARSAPATLPLALGNLAEDGSATVFASFQGNNLTPGTSPVMKVEGTYIENGREFKFALESPIRIPPASPGKADAQGASSPPNIANGARFPEQAPKFTDETNEGHAWIPPLSTARGPAPVSPQSVPQPAPKTDPPNIDFIANRGIGISQSTVAEPSGGVGGKVIFMTSNWYAAYSANGGVFNKLSPTTIFPNNVDGGFCCDQIVVYAPSIDRIVWLMQYGQGATGESRYRIAAASPASIISSSGTSWTYWDITSTQIGFPSEFLDYPDMSLGNNSLYASFDQVNSGGRVIVRIPLSEIGSGSTINFRFTKNTDSPMCYGGHLTQNAGDSIFWAGPNSNSSMRVFNWPESSNSYSWRDVNVGSWPNDNTKLTSITPDKQDWLTKLRNFPGNAVLGSTRVTQGKTNQVWFAWSAAAGNNFPQPQVQWVAVDLNNNFNVVTQQQIWNPNYAFAYPAFATNSKGEVGMSMEYGGGGNYENHVVGFWSDFIVYVTTASSIGTTRYGDYTSIRQNAQNPAVFDAFGYGLLKPVAPATATVVDSHYVQFGR